MLGRDTAMLLVAIFPTYCTTTAVLAAPENTEVQRKIGTNAGLERNTTLLPPEDGRRIVLCTIDAIITISQDRGDSEQATIWTAFKAAYSDVDHSRHAIATAVGSYKLACFLREHDELLTAHRFAPHLLTIADIVRSEKPELYMAAHQEMAMLDVIFERYDSAQEHMSIALKTIQQNQIERHLSLPCRANHAMVLRKLKRFNEAEKLYVQLLDELKADATGITNDQQCDLRFALAALYAEMGDFEKYRDTIPESDADLYSVDGEFASNRAATMLIGSSKAALAAKGDLRIAEKKLMEYSEWAKRNYGFSSLRYLEATELLAKIYIAQNRKEEAKELLSRAASIRDGLLGERHPSVVRLHDEIKSLNQ